MVWYKTKSKEKVARLPFKVFCHIQILYLQNPSLPIETSQPGSQGSMLTEECRGVMLDLVMGKLLWSPVVMEVSWLM